MLPRIDSQDQEPRVPGHKREGFSTIGGVHVGESVIQGPQFGGQDEGQRVLRALVLCPGLDPGFADLRRSSQIFADKGLFQLDRSPRLVAPVPFAPFLQLRSLASVPWGSVSMSANSSLRRLHAAKTLWLGHGPEGPGLSSNPPGTESVFLLAPSPVNFDPSFKLLQKCRSLYFILQA